MAECGTVSSYSSGCRCEDCRAAKSEYRIEWAKRRKESDDSEWHGTLSGYITYKCRCVECGQFWGQYKRAWKLKGNNLDKARQYNREYHAANPDKRRNYEARRRAIKSGSQVFQFSSYDIKKRWEYYGNCCYLCGDSATETDHVKPLAKGGAHMLANLRPICSTCNMQKRDRWPYPKQEHNV